MTKFSFDDYISMSDSQRGKLERDELMEILESQVGKPHSLPEDTLRSIIKNTIEKSIEEKIPPPQKS